MPAKKYNTDEERRAAMRASERKWRAANPDKVKGYRRNKKPYALKSALEKANTAERLKKYRAAQRRILDAIQLRYGCMNPDCLWKGPYTAAMLDFHHINPAEKSFCVSQFYGIPVTLLAAEINKCCVLCSNCHRMETWGDLDCSGFVRCTVDAGLFRGLTPT
jgi:hypothetical protein